MEIAEGIKVINIKSVFDSNMYHRTSPSVVCGSQLWDGVLLSPAGSARRGCHN